MALLSDLYNGPRLRLVVGPHIGVASERIDAKDGDMVP